MDLTPTETIVLNDGFGALALALHKWRPTVVTDSINTESAIAINAERNGISAADVRVVNPLEPWPDKPNLVLLKVPKNQRYLAYLLGRLRKILPPNTVVYGSGMAKHIHKSTLALFESIIGPTRTSLAKKKARLIFSQIDPDISPNTCLDPAQYVVDSHDITLVDLPNVFSNGKLDQGTRILLEHLPSGPMKCADLGCGNGVLGIALAKVNPDASLILTDVSHMAVESARKNWLRNGLAPERAVFRVADCLSDIASSSLDFIVCNPPFHEGHAVGDHIAWRMFNQARSCLGSGGVLRVVANRHLGHHVRIKRLFGNCRVLSSTPKFVVLSATK